MLKKILLLVVCIILIGSVLAPQISNAENDSEALDVILIEGQSNAENWLVGTTLEQIDSTIGEPSKKVYYSANTVYAGDFDEKFKDYSVRIAYDSGWKVGGYIAALGKLWTDTYGRDVLFINTGIGSSSIEKLSPDGVFWDYVNKMIDDGLNSDIVKSYPKINKICWLWCQGEFDTHTVSEYTSYFKSLQSAMNSYGFNDCYVIQTRMADSNNSISALKAIINTDPNVHLGTDISDFFTKENGLLYSDSVHYTQLGRNMISDKLIQVIPAPHNTPDIGMLKIVIVVMLAALVVGAIGFIALRRAD